MINRSLVTDIYVGDDGKLHKVKGGADSVLPFSSGFEMTLLWTNPNHKTNFAEKQTLDLDLSEYNYVYVESFYNTVEWVTYSGSTLIPVGSTGGIFAAYSNDSARYTNHRVITVSTTGISFTFTSGGAEYCIPYKIYGIK